jgi:hypothetical protein
VTSPYGCHPDTRYIRPVFLANYYTADQGNVVEIDDLVIDAFDEDGQNRLYLGIASGGVINPDKVIETSITNNAVTTNKIYAGSVTAGKISVAQLSGISADLGSITAGVITGAQVQTAGSGSRVVIDSTNGLRGYSGSTLVFQLPVSSYSALSLYAGIRNLSGPSFSMAPLSDGDCELILIAKGGVAKFSSSGTPGVPTDILLSPYFGGVVRFGTYTGTPGSITGYITVKDAAGNTRKLAVIS